MDELEKEINSIQIDQAALAEDILAGKSPEVISIFASTVIMALAADAHDMIQLGQDPEELLAAIVSFAGVIVNVVPEEFYPEAVDTLKHLDDAIAMTHGLNEQE